MLSEILAMCLLVVVTVTMHALGFSVLLRAVTRSRVLFTFGLWSSCVVVICLTMWLILVHLAGIAVWGLFYFSKGCFPDLESAIYFSGTTYTSVGYGDLVLAKPWRMLAPIETLTGILMCGLSTGIFFAVMFRRIGNWMKTQEPLEAQTPPRING